MHWNQGTYWNCLLAKIDVLGRGPDPEFSYGILDKNVILMSGPDSDTATATMDYHTKRAEGVKFTVPLDCLFPIRVITEGIIAACSVSCSDSSIMSI